MPRGRKVGYQFVYCRKGHLLIETRNKQGACGICSNARSRRWWWKHVQGVDQAWVDRQLQIQDDRCVICKRLFADDCRPQIDHDHAGKKVREILCQSCNSLLGFAGDDIEILKSAIGYLQKFV